MQLEVPDGHQVGMRVPKGGSSCATCEYLQPKNHCGNEYWLNWHDGDELIPAPADSYCCDFYSEKRRAARYSERYQEGAR